MRLMREAYRFNEAWLNELSAKYDWVLNAKSTLLAVKVSSPAQEFAAIVDRVSKSEVDASAAEQLVDKAIVE